MSAGLRVAAYDYVFTGLRLLRGALGCSQNLACSGPTNLLDVDYENGNGACRILQQYNRYNALFIRGRKGAFHCHNESVV
jgi:hypothetical protein